jgi:hypothetical protein
MDPAHETNTKTMQATQPRRSHVDFPSRPKRNAVQVYRRGRLAGKHRSCLSLDPVHPFAADPMA